jgi:recombination protein RecT
VTSIQEQAEGADRAQVAAQEQTASIEAKVRGAYGWFKSVIPKHIDPDQFVALCIGALRKDRDLQEAATLNPGPFMVAASECARLGLVPGDTYHFVSFKNRETGLRDITGIVDYKGEIDMIYRAGGVTSVHCHVVRARDKFLWQPGMELPLHEIKANTHGQIGLGDDSDRGDLTGAYAYARQTDGSYSAPIVMSRSEILKHKAAAKSKKFWDGVWEPDMWLKTVVHKLYDRVPHSQEYMMERLRAQNAPPIPGGAHHPVPVPGSPDVPALESPIVSPPARRAEPTGNRRNEAALTPEPGRQQEPGSGSQNDEPTPDQVSRATKRMHALLGKGGAALSGQADRDLRLALVSAVLRLRDEDGSLHLISSTSDLSFEQTRKVGDALSDLVDQERSRDTSPEDIAARFREIAVMAVTASQQPGAADEDRNDGPPWDGE